MARPVFRVEEQPDFVQAPHVAVGYVDVEDAVITGRQVPCICPEQENGATGRTVSYSTARGNLREQVRCDLCGRTWTRVNC